MGNVLAAPLELSIFASIKLTSTNEEWVLNKGIGVAGNREFGLAVISNKVVGFVADESEEDVDTATSTSNVGTDWVTVGFTWDGVGRTYLNGVRDGAGASGSLNSGDIESLSAPLEIGRDATPDYFDGQIGWIGMWNRGFPNHSAEAQHLHDRPDDMITRRPTFVAMSSVSVTIGPFPWYTYQNFTGNIQSPTGGIG
jgi:hypothetical protein